MGRASSNVKKENASQAGTHRLLDRPGPAGPVWVFRRHGNPQFFGPILVFVLEHFKRHAIQADAWFLVPGFFLLMGEGALIVLDLARREGGPDALQSFGPLGLLFVVAGLGFAIGGAFTLRGNYSSTLVIRESHELIVHGIYRFVRHPVYLGTILVLVGGPIGTSSWLALFPVLLLIPLFLYRMGIEEGLLIEEFGDEYRAYMAHTKRLIPFVY